jgi:uncharacterized membrane protein
METSLITAFEAFAGYVALAAELVSTLLIAVGVVDAVGRIAIRMLAQRASIRGLKDVWLRLAAWILMALEFALGADIVRSCISPTWEEVGKLAAIAGIRTVLSYFLERDLAAFEREHPGAAGRAA